MLKIFTDPALKSKIPMHKHPVGAGPASLLIDKY
jgi:hypothetical protein